MMKDTKAQSGHDRYRTGTTRRGVGAGVSRTIKSVVAKANGA